MDRGRGETQRFPENLPGENPRRRDDGRMTTTARQQRLGFLGPNWFASVMGTGIVATAGATLPLHVPGLRAFAEAVWVASTVWLVMLVVAVAAQSVRHPTGARSCVYIPQT